MVVNQEYIFLINDHLNTHMIVIQENINIVLINDHLNTHMVVIQEYIILLTNNHMCV